VVVIRAVSLVHRKHHTADESGTRIALAPFIECHEADATRKEITMSQVSIRRCPVCPTIRAHTDEVVTALNKEPATKVKVDNGDKGEFTVMVNGQIVVQKIGELLPTTEEVAAAVQRESLAGNVV
jgi:hypothetical protein